MRFNHDGHFFSYLVVARAAELTAFGVDVNAAICVGQRLVTREGELLASLLDGWSVRVDALELHVSTAAGKVRHNSRGNRFIDCGLGQRGGKVVGGGGGHGRTNKEGGCVYALDCRRFFMGDSSVPDRKRALFLQSFIPTFLLFVTIINIELRIIRSSKYLLELSRKIGLV